LGFARGALVEGGRLACAVLGFAHRRRSSGTDASAARLGFAATSALAVGDVMRLDPNRNG
jgi:hypothetical protein